MKPNVYDYILGMYVSDDANRPSLTSIFPNEDYYCATDGHILIATKKGKLGKEYDGIGNYPNALGLIKNNQSNETYHFDRTEFLQKLYEAEFIWKKTHLPCEECSGTGSKECKCCGSESDCKDCNGSGESDEIKIFSNLELEGEKIKLFDTYFYPNYLNLILQTAFFLEADTITIRQQKEAKNKSFLFEINDVIILLMPIIKSI